MHQPNALLSDRASAQRFEQALPLEQRKRFGQFFTGVKLGKLLAALSLKKIARNIVDPMAGHGDLLDAVLDIARTRNIHLEKIDGVEIDESTARFCADRISGAGSKIDGLNCFVANGDAFNTSSRQHLAPFYDLVITNPPYVRYQAQGETSIKNTRNALRAALKQFAPSDVHVWRELVDGYSGLADLSVPSWILAALMVGEGGRLAIVVPSTWRTRDYGDVIRYLMLRFFTLEYVVEDTQPGWFSNALVRTQLIVARRLTSSESATRLSERKNWLKAVKVVIGPGAADDNSIVGKTFPGENSESDFSEWLSSSNTFSKPDISVELVDLYGEWQSLRGLKPRRWLRNLNENMSSASTVLGQNTPIEAAPPIIQSLVSNIGSVPVLTTLDQQGISLGQGLRTGCNRFFYVDVVGEVKNGTVRVRTSKTFEQGEFDVPQEVLHPVLRKQSEISGLLAGEPLLGAVLDLRQWVLPEELSKVSAARATYQACDEALPRTMPEVLADYVRRAAKTGEGREESELIPALSAVRTNVRPHRPGLSTPRFWYMLPEFQPRHKPQGFVARVLHGTPWVECNVEPAALIDANFSTFWSENWSRFALKALLNSAWCRLFMESLGTPLGGGALKLEATHLRRLLIPTISPAIRERLHQIGEVLSPSSAESLREIDTIILDALAATAQSDLAHGILETADALRKARQRNAA